MDYPWSHNSLANLKQRLPTAILKQKLPSQAPNLNHHHDAPTSHPISRWHTQSHPRNTPSSPKTATSFSVTSSPQPRQPHCNNGHKKSMTCPARPRRHGCHTKKSMQLESASCAGQRTMRTTMASSMSS